MHKYRARQTIVDNVKFASAKEAGRYSELKLLMFSRTIDRLTLQPKFNLFVNGKHICDYIADFSYYENNCQVVEDVKGFKTKDYIIKRKLLLALYPDTDHREI